MFVSEPPWTKAAIDSRDSKQAKKLNKLEVRKYLEGWYDSVDVADPEMAVINAFSDQGSLVDWFGTLNVEYDDDYALQISQQLFDDDNS